MSVVLELSMFPGLRGLAVDELSLLASVVKRREPATGEVVVKQDEAGRSCFFLVRGAVEMKKEIGGKQLLLNNLREGSIFGQIGLIGQGPRTASVVATEPCVVLELQRSDFDSLLESGRLVALRVQEQIALSAIRQLRTVTRRLSLLQDRQQQKPDLRNVRDALADWDVDLDKVEVVTPGLSRSHIRRR